MEGQIILKQREPVARYLRPKPHFGAHFTVGCLRLSHRRLDKRGRAWKILTNSRDGLCGDSASRRGWWWVSPIAESNGGIPLGGDLKGGTPSKCGVSGAMPLTLVPRMQNLGRDS